MSSTDMICQLIILENPLGLPFMAICAVQKELLAPTHCKVFEKPCSALRVRK